MLKLSSNTRKAVQSSLKYNEFMNLFTSPRIANRVFRNYLFIDDIHVYQRVSSSILMEIRRLYV